MIRHCIHCQNLLKENEENFCCVGCEAAYGIINKLGFGNYYNLREIDQKERKIKPEIAEEIDISEFVLKNSDGFCSVSLIIQGLHCAACVWLIESILKKQKNVLAARINLSKKTLFLKWQGDVKAGNELAHLIAEIGYKLLPFDEAILKSEEKKYNDKILRALAVAGFGVGNIMLFSFSLWFTDSADMGNVTRNLLHFFSSLIALPVIIFSSRVFFSSAWKSIKSGFPNMDLAISVAIFLACVVSLLETFQSKQHVYFDSVVMLIFFLLIGRYLDFKARKKAFAIATEFSLLQVSFGRVEENSKIKILPVKNLHEGMILLVSAGEKIAADGIVIEGKSEVDASMINGEILPKEILCGDEAYAGMINLGAPLKIKITKSPQNSLLAEIIRLSEEVENKKNHYIRIADRLAKFYLPAVHILALITFLLWYFYFQSGFEIALMNATAVLIITCPCALALAVPIVQTIAVSNFIKKGILVKSGEALEKLREAEVIIFDKTGSLTIGQPKLIDVFLLRENEKISLNAEERNFYLQLAASLAKKSKHPLSAALTKAFDGNLIELPTQEIQGFGLEAVVENKEFFDNRPRNKCGVTVLQDRNQSCRPALVAGSRSSIKLGRKEFCKIKNSVQFDEKLLSCFMKFGDEEIIFLFADEIKQDASLVISQLKKLGKEIILLSGDNEKIVRDVSEKLAIDEFYFEQTPLSKMQFLEKLKSQKKKLIMVGDGINDAPALASADISISFSKASDISQNIADIIIQGRKLTPIIELMNSSKKAISLMKENLFLALIYNLIAVPFAVMGHVVPLIAAIAMSSSSLLVLLNSLRMNQKNLEVRS